MGLHRDERLLAAIESVGPVCRLTDLEPAGVPRSAARRMLRQRTLRRLTRWTLVTARTWEAASGWEKFQLKSLAVGLSGPRDMHLTGWAAAVLHRLPVLGSPPAVPVGVRPGDPHRSPQRTESFRYRHGWLPEHRRSSVLGVRVVDQAYAAMDVARHVGRAAGLLVADKALAGGVTSDDLFEVCDNLRHHPGVDDARWCAEHGSSRSESPVETLGRWAFLNAGRSAPIPNVWFWRDGHRYRGDLYLPDQMVVLEADGAVKYNNRPDADQVIKSQVMREERMRSWNLGFVRYTHAEAHDDPDGLVRRADRAAILRPDLPLICRWSPDPPWQR